MISLDYASFLLNAYEIFSVKNYSECIQRIIKIILTTFIMFSLQAELLDGKVKMKLKDTAIPTIFNHAKPVKQRESSIERDDEKIKKQLIEEALQSCSTQSTVSPW